MVLRQKYIESLFCAIISELDPNNKKNKLYMNLCNAINNEGFDIKFSERNDLIYDHIIDEYNKCFEKSIQKQNDIQNEDNNEFEKKYEIIREIGIGGFGQVFEVKNLLDNHIYAVKKTYPKSKLSLSFLY